MTRDLSNPQRIERWSLQNFVAGCIEACPSAADTDLSEPIVYASVRFVPDNAFFELALPWIKERGPAPQEAPPEVPAEDLEALVRNLIQREFRHLVIQCASAPRAESLIANALAKHLQSHSAALSITRLEEDNQCVAFSTCGQQKSGDSFRRS
jgi:hypothetical protein